MNHSIYSADRATYMKILAAALVASIGVAGLGTAVRINSNNEFQDCPRHHQDQSTPARDNVRGCVADALNLPGKSGQLETHNSGLDNWWTRYSECAGMATFTQLDTDQLSPDTRELNFCPPTTVVPVRFRRNEQAARPR